MKCTLRLLVLVQCEDIFVEANGGGGRYPWDCFSAGVHAATLDVGDNPMEVFPGSGIVWVWSIWIAAYESVGRVRLSSGDGDVGWKGSLGKKMWCERIRDSG
jgi:hypothetical protein